MRPYLKNPITEKGWDSVSRSESKHEGPEFKTTTKNSNKTKQENQTKKNQPFDCTGKQTSGRSRLEGNPGKQFAQ
jgi:hypothetical protein